MDPYPSLSRNPYGRSDEQSPASISMNASPSVVDDQPPEELKGPGISFERDIQPLSRRMFGMTFGRIKNPRMAAESFAEANSTLQNAYMRNAQIRDADAQLRERRIRYETAVFSLASARDAARKERERMQSLIPLQNELSSIVGDPATDQETKQVALSQFAIRNAQSLATDPAAATAFSAAQKGLTKDQTQLTVASYLNSGRGSAKFLSDYNEEFKRLNGRDLEAADPIPAVRAFTASEEERKGAAQERLREEQRIEKEKRDQANMEKVLDSVHTIKMKQDTDTGAPPALANPSDEAYLTSVIERFATPDEKKTATDLNSRLQLAKTIRSDYYSGKRSFTPAPAPGQKLYEGFTK